MPSLDALCGVEVQLCFHYCALGDLLRFARCDSRLYALADQPFSMKFAVLRLSSRGPRAVPAGPLSTRLKHAQLHLSCWSGLSALDVDRMVALASVHPCHTLDATSVDLMSTTQLFRLIASPCLQSLQAFHMHRDVTSWNSDASAMVQLSLFPQLQTLSLTPRSSGFEGWRALRSFPALTRLDVEDTFTNASASPMDHIAHCCLLQQLHLRTPALYGNRFGRILGTARLSSLLSLSLDTLFTNGILAAHCPAIKPEEYRAVFTNLSNLTDLSLCCIYQIDSMLAHVHLASSLKRLQVQPDCTLRSTQRASLPSSSVMKQLLTALPQLACVIRIDGRAGPQLQDACLALCADLAEFESLVLQTPTRVRLALPTQWQLN